MIKTSILDYEVRFDINKEYIRFIDRLNHTKISYDCPYSTFANEFSFIEDFEENIEYFPFNKTSRTFNEFLLDRGIEDGRIPVKEKVELTLFTIIIFLTYLSWLKLEDYYSNFTLFFYKKDVIESIIFSIEFILENTNYKVVYEKNDEYDFELPYLIKQDVDVDSVLTIVSEDTSLDLLSYLDFRNENNLQVKEEILRKLYIDLESKKDELSKSNKNLFDDTKWALNYCRHHRTDDLSDVDKIILCDKAFYMYIQLLCDPIIKQYRRDLKPLKAA